MTTNEIEKIIKTKGAVAKDTFNTLLKIYYIDRTGTIHMPEYYDEDVIAEICYNVTIMFMNKLLENPDYFEKNYNIKERNRIRVRKDLETMELLKLSDDSAVYVKEIVDLLQVE